MTSVSVVTGTEKNGGSMLQRRKVLSGFELPPSPGGLLRPDRFQFYTLNKNGEVITKQMTEKEIQTLIAAGGGHFPMEIHETQTAGDVPTSGMKVHKFSLSHLFPLHFLLFPSSFVNLLLFCLFSKSYF